MPLETTLERTNVLLEQLIAAMLKAGAPAPLVAEMAQATRAPATEVWYEVLQPEPEPAQALSYDTDVRPVLLELAKLWKDPLKLAEFLGQFGAAKGPELRTDQYPDVIAAARSLIGQKAAA